MESTVMMMLRRLRVQQNVMMSGSLFTNSNWFAFEDERTADDHSTGPVASSAPNTEEDDDTEGSGNVVVKEDEDIADTAASGPPKQAPSLSPMVISLYTQKQPYGPLGWQEAGSGTRPVQMGIFLIVSGVF